MVVEHPAPTRTGASLALLVSLATSCTLAIARDPSDAAQGPRSVADACAVDAQCDGVGASCHPDDHVCLLRCPSVVIDDPSDLAAARHCREIDGDLTFRSADLEVVSPDDLPYLERVSGSLFSIGGKAMRELTLPALREVGATGAATLIEIGLDGTHLQRVALPALQVVHGSVSFYGLYALRELDLAALTQVDGMFSLVSLPRLDSVQLAPELDPGGSTEFHSLCDLAPQAIALAFGGGDARKAIGCCTRDALDCDPFSCACP
jgi:hypothetical protein